MTVVHRAPLSGNIHLDLLAGTESGHWVDEGRHPLVAGLDVILDGLHSEELRGAVLALVELAAPFLRPMVSLDMVCFADLQGVLFA